ncbi:selenoneine biosynthesis selenosugar synthase SenB [Marinobacter sp. chi1]|uniref:Selenoneine biosynthesis selenosugar synthase SenB n=1 Tax=Marinobacter suaedae TaxID=3057675 RepID=A0ABT8W1T5_9GAMM|nr:selenoneine biosynthesis selenosugar synthase SenB [Marinobacter sp. chi1]MDO3722208.1 selenoneine biosynthesis selenosugar synthase SenB [Marinobacter sp. chi1]
MDIIVITPAPPGSRAGNRATAERWTRLLQCAGHNVRIATDYNGERCDVCIALHAWRSHDAIQVLRRMRPEVPLILALTGTDIYHHQHEFPIPSRASMAASDVLIGLHHLVYQDIPEPFRSKLVTVYQSADKIERSKAPVTNGHFTACVLGHLRDEKDSLRAAKAARLLPSASQVQILCAGKPHNKAWQADAEGEMQANPRFRWLGELGRNETADLLRTADIMVISSVMEGGANVVSEACRAGLPILASDIPGNRGLLGDGYEGYFAPKDERALAQLLERAENDPAYLQRLTEQVAQVSPTFTPEREQAGLLQALDVAVRRRKALGE